MIARALALAKALRLDQPWLYKAPLLVAIPYLFLATGDIAPGVAGAVVGASLVTIAGFCGFGYVVNDIADREQDARAGRSNFAAERRPLELGAWVTGLLALALAPWGTVLPMTVLTGSLIALELGLFAAYSVPPVRLKDRGFLGALTDALYAHAVPAVLAAAALGALVGGPDRLLAPLLATVGPWQLASGLRNILLHQIEDLDKDASSGGRTWAIHLGRNRAERVLRRFLVPAELALFAGFVAVVARELPAFAPSLGLALAFIVWSRRRRGLELDLRSFLFYYVDDLYVEWVPVLVLAAAAISRPALLLLLALHLAVFPKNATRRVRVDGQLALARRPVS